MDELEDCTIYIVIEGGVVDAVFVPTLDIWENYEVLDLDTDDPVEQNLLGRKVSALYDFDCESHREV